MSETDKSSESVDKANEILVKEIKSETDKEQLIDGESLFHHPV